LPFAHRHWVRQEGIAAHLNFFQPHLAQARPYADSLRPGRAEAALQKVVGLEPNQPLYKFNLAGVLNYHLGAVLVRLGQKDLARERLAKALDGDEDFTGRGEAERPMKELTAS